MKHIISSEWQSGMHFVAESLGGVVVLDSAEEIGGRNLGMRPKALMLTSLAGCTGMDVIAILRKMKAEVEDFKVIVEGDLSEEHPKVYTKVLVHYHFNGLSLNKDAIQKAVDLSVDKYCGVYEMFRQFCDISYQIHLNQ